MNCIAIVDHIRVILAVCTEDCGSEAWKKESFPTHKNTGDS